VHTNQDDEGEDHDLYDDYDTAEELLEVRGKAFLRATTLSANPLKFLTEDPSADASPAFLEALLAYKNQGRVRIGTAADIGFLDAAFFANGFEVERIVNVARPIEPWMLAEFLAAQWYLSPPPLLTDLPNWFYFREGLVSATHRPRDKKWGIDIRPVEDTLFESGSRIFVSF
jgi:hypothetical protein